ncbi:MAG: RNA methyltransferase [Clostridia bacterium]|nr:RNA methyltransferase [Clostridia bacterium]
MNIITSSKNPLIKSIKDLSAARGRESAKMFLVEGEVMIREALKCGLTLHHIIATEKRIEFALSVSAEAVQVTDSVMQAACDTKTPQGVCAVFGMPEPLPIEKLPDRIVALDGVQDPGNVGTIWRTADAAGFEAMLLGAGSADPMSPKVQRSAMGSGFRIPISKTSDMPAALAKLAAAGYSIICSDLHGEDFYARPDPGKKFVLVIGNEARGISDATRAQATMLVRLPMRGGAESLNAAVAAGIMMYELMR